MKLLGHRHRTVKTSTHFAKLPSESSPQCISRTAPESALFPTLSPTLTCNSLFALQSHCQHMLCHFLICIFLLVRLNVFIGLLPIFKTTDTACHFDSIISLHPSGLLCFSLCVCTGARRVFTTWERRPRSGWVGGWASGGFTLFFLFLK